MSLSDARAARLENLALASKGTDPFPRRARDMGEEAKTWAFDACVQRFIDEYLKRFNKRPQEGERILRKHFVESWRGRDVRKIEWSDLKAILAEIGESGGHRASNIAFSRIRKFFNWLRKDADRVADLPVSPLYNRSPLYPENSPRERVLSKDELVVLWREADTLGYPYAPIFQLLALLGQRRSEVAGMRWLDLDLSEATWSMPGRRTKNSQPHVLPLPDLAVKIIRACPRVDDSPFVFPSAHDAGKQLTGFTAMKRQLDKCSGVEDWTLHDLRRTQATMMPDLDVSETVVERIHNHTLPRAHVSASAKIYNLYKYQRQMREALERYAAYVVAMVGTAEGARQIVTSRGEW